MTYRSALRLAAILVLIAGTAYLATREKLPVSLATAEQLYFDNALSAADVMYDTIAADTLASASERAGAMRGLARIDWLVRRNSARAAALLAFPADGNDRCENLALALRIFDSLSDADEAIAIASREVAQCSGQEGAALRLALAQALMRQNSGQTSVSEAKLSAASNALSGIVGPAALSPEVGAASLHLALLQRDAQRAFAAWRRYFWLSETDAPQAMSAYAGKVETLFSMGLRADATAGDRLALAALLARAGFVFEAQGITAGIADSGLDEADATTRKRLFALYEFFDAAQKLIAEANVAIANGNDADNLRQDLMGLIQGLAEDAGLEGDPVAAIEEAFGIYGTVGRTSGFMSVHAGFIMEDRAAEISQNGRAASVRLIILGNMLANGYQTWMWDGAASTGGWTPDPATIVQVRNSYASGAVKNYALTSAGPERDAYNARTAELADAERESLAGNAIAALPATSRRLRLAGLDAIASKYGPEPEAIIASIYSVTNEYSIILHEGRHALDKAAHGENLSSAELEFRAKLSELAFSDEPRLPLAVISSTEVGTGTPHGEANGRILAAFQTWMQAHESEIAGFQPGTPHLSQLDKLTIAQIQAIARDSDPEGN